MRQYSLLFLISLTSTPAKGWDGIPPEGTPPLLLGLYNTPEVREPVQLEVTGEIPRWVKGSLYRGAQAGWDAGNYTSEHWFDGFTRNHRFEIEDGKVSYRSRNASDEVMDCELVARISARSILIISCSHPRNRFISWPILWR